MVRCEYCGNEINQDNCGSFHITINCNNWHGSFEEDYIRGEYSSSHFMHIGDMCEDCAKMILYQIEGSIKELGFPERYEDVDKDRLKETIKRGRMKYGKND